MTLKQYEDLAIWREIQKFLPQSNRIDEETKPYEIGWEWEENRIHIDHYPCPAAKVKVILLHGVGGNGRLLSFMGVPLWRRGFEVIAPDLPGYGLSMISKTADYDSWVRLVSDLVNCELQKDNKPIVLFGLSAGGMLAYHAACLNKKVSGVIATNMLDQRLQRVRDESAVNKFVNRIGTPLLTLTARINNEIKIPVSFVANMKAIVNNADLVKLLLQDKTASGARVTLKFILSLIDAQPDIEPENFDICPVLLVHPQEDKWTPVDLSLLFYNRLKCRKQLTMLDNAGHFPIEQPGIAQLEQSVVEFLQAI